jgi:hypothetical protein
MDKFLAKLMEAMIIAGTMLCRTKTNETDKITKKCHGPISKKHI